MQPDPETTRIVSDTVNSLASQAGPFLAGFLALMIVGTIALCVVLWMVARFIRDTRAQGAAVATAPADAQLLHEVMRFVGDNTRAVGGLAESVRGVDNGLSRNTHEVQMLRTTQEKFLGMRPMSPVEMRPPGTVGEASSGFTAGEGAQLR